MASSQHKTDCVYFEWKYVNYSSHFNVDKYWNAGSHEYIAWCRRDDVDAQGNSLRDKFRAPIPRPCEDCPYYEQGEEKGQSPPG